MLGPTGAGKTTLLRTIAGLEQPDAGTITMAGRDVTALDPAARDVALVFQNFSLYPRWSVRRNLEFPLRAPGRNLPEAEIQSRVAWAADLLRITRYLDREASRLSGGEMQRVAIGRAIVRRPRLFLMDEPLTNLDAKLREALRVELVELRRELETPMVFVTHDQAEALSMADRIVVLSEGRILQTGTPREIYERPASPVVALQLGQPAINLLPVRREGGQWRAADGTPLMRAEASGPGERLLGVRPENVALLGGEAASEAVVRVVEHTGPTTTLLVDWLGSRVHIVVPRRAAVRPGDRVHPRIDPARAVLFDADARAREGEPMTARSFEPKFMKMSVLTAALQELTPRRIRDEDPDRAIEDWLAFARELDCPNIQISAALHPTETDVPPEAMLDPVANTLDLRKPFDKARAKRVLAAMQATGVGATDIAFFDNLLHDDNDLRKKKHDFVVRMMDAAALLGLEAVCGFVGRNQKLSMDQNLVFFEEVFIPLLKEAKARRLEYRVEQCPMPGWTVGDNFHNNIAYTPGDVDRAPPDLRAARRRRPVPRPLRSLARDPDGAGHAVDLPVPQGRGLRLHHRRLPRQGSGDRFQGRGGLGIRRPDRRARRLEERQAVAEPGRSGQRLEEADRALPSTSCRARRSTIRSATCRTAPSTGWTTSSPRASCLKLDVANTALVIEHEYPRARIQDKERLAPILKGSIAFARKIDEAAACMYALHHEVLPAQDIPVQGRGRVAYWT